jgi:hypothetical protein
MFSKTRLAVCLRHLVPMVLVGALVAGCANDSLPTEPTPRPTGLSLTGPATINHPGETAAFVVIATFDDGSSRDVTGEAVWAPQRKVLSMAARGLARAEKYGTEQLTVFYSGVSKTTYVRVAPEGAFLVDGSVLTEGGRPIPNVQVEFVSHCGTMAAVTDDNGRYVLPAQGPATMRVGKEGYEDVSLVVDVSADGAVDFTLRFAPGTGQASAQYQLDVSASSSCNLPQEAMRRSWQALIEQVDSRLFVIVSGGDFVAWGNAGFTGERKGDTLLFVLGPEGDDEYWLVERIPGIGDVYFSGTATGTYDKARFILPFSGTIEVVTSSEGGGINASCQADDHQLEFVRLGGS